MKRRNVESSVGKLRRVAKRSKISDGYSVLINFKVLSLWALVFLLDFVADFRFELLYPFWAYFNHLGEILKFKGISYLFAYICVTLSLDMICYYFIPLQWLFFASSTYVWIQFSWYSDRGLSAMALLVWSFFICIEAFLRVRTIDLKNIPMQYELCRPLAAHGIGYPLFSFGVSCKTFVHYKLQQHTRLSVAKENEYYYSLLQQALGTPQIDELAALPPPADPGSSVSTTPTHSQLQANGTTTLLSLAQSHQNGDVRVAKNQLISPHMHNNNTAGVKSSPVTSTAVTNAISNGVSAIATVHLTRRQSIVNTANVPPSVSPSATTSAIVVAENRLHSRSRSTRMQIIISSLLKMTFGPLITLGGSLRGTVSKCHTGLVNSIHQFKSRLILLLPGCGNTVDRDDTQPKNGTNPTADSNSIQSVENSENTPIIMPSSGNVNSGGKGGGGGGGKNSRGGSPNAQFTLIDSQQLTVASIGGLGNTCITTVKTRTHSKSSKSTIHSNQNCANSLVAFSKSTVEQSQSKKCNNSSKSELPKNSKDNGESAANQPQISNSVSVTDSSGSSSGKLLNQGKQKESKTESSVSANGNVHNTETQPTLVTANNNNNVIDGGHSHGTSNSNSRNSSNKRNNHNNKQDNKRNSIDNVANLLEQIKSKDDYIWKLESDNQRLKTELQTVRRCENDLRDQLKCSLATEKDLKTNVTNYQNDIEMLQKKLQSNNNWKQQMKQTIQKLEKQLEEERKRLRVSQEAHSISEKKARLAEENAVKANAMANAARNACSDACRQRLRDLENERTKLRKDLQHREDQLRSKDRLLAEMREVKDNRKMLLSTLQALHEKNAQLEDALNLEKMCKLEAFHMMDTVEDEIDPKPDENSEGDSLECAEDTSAISDMQRQPSPPQMQQKQQQQQQSVLNRRRSPQESIQKIHNNIANVAPLSNNNIMRVNAMNGFEHKSSFHHQSANSQKHQQQSQMQPPPHQQQQSSQYSQQQQQHHHQQQQQPQHMHCNGNVDMDLVTVARSFSSCSPRIHHPTASPSSLSSGTPPLPVLSPAVVQPLLDCAHGGMQARPLSNIGNISPVAISANNTSQQFQQQQAPPSHHLQAQLSQHQLQQQHHQHQQAQQSYAAFNMMREAQIRDPSHRDASLQNFSLELANVPWPSALKSTQSTSLVTGGSLTSQTDLISESNFLQSNCTGNTGIGKSISESVDNFATGLFGKFTDFDPSLVSANGNVAPLAAATVNHPVTNLSFNSRFDM